MYPIIEIENNCIYLYTKINIHKSPVSVALEMNYINLCE